ncbi:gamma-glutamylcyclotransferase family protein [Ramlibacter alkalitolerans]|uniref:Gamma-glutamylcyclotransferase n=1 Tax=Ramlibacter alkalitolerans TaxID=2039631 RepID=A0ABS1JWX0_9BURK|nr:gamma-glutamylcyclotransferase family protein [Ramlibacter alkalitolerans]MBL0428815.1 gamma-glutamylcyclotransferase [Ramlibacter alkalitolerans]
MPEAPERHVFVYGTLRRGGRNDINRLSPAPDYVGMGEVRGVLYHLDWYPGLALGGEEAVTVVGEVYRISAELEAILDGIEQIVPGADSEYFKREVEIAVQGRPVTCLLYEINPVHVRERRPMGHGDWIVFHHG